MTEEIKEILNKLKYIVDFPIIEHDTSFNPDNVEESVCLLISNECQLLLDCITNLQQEINKLTAESTEWESKYYDLQQENEFLKLNNPEQNMEHFRIIKENKRKIDNLRKENKELNRMCELHSKSLYNAELTDYKSRCEGTINLIDRTIEIIKQQPTKDDSWILSRLYGFKYALNGSDEK